MAKQILGASHSHHFSKSHILGQKGITLQQISFQNQIQIGHRTLHELAQNPALLYRKEDDLIRDLEPETGDDDWNGDYSKPEEEYETGDTFGNDDPYTVDLFNIADHLEQAVIEIYENDADALKEALNQVDHYRAYGALPTDADEKLYEALSLLEKSISHSSTPETVPTFEIEIINGEVEVYVLPAGGNLDFVKKIKKLSVHARDFIDMINERNQLLCNFGDFILKTIQWEFFLQDELDTALLFLIPAPVDKISDYIKSSPFQIDKKYLSKLGDHLVKCDFGVLPLNTFLLNRAQLIRMWVGYAYKIGVTNEKKQLELITRNISERLGTWNSNDIRHKFASQLEDITLTDIKNARRLFRGRDHARKQS